jgi:hypothetical protein
MCPNPITAYRTTRGSRLRRALCVAATFVDSPSVKICSFCVLIEKILDKRPATYIPRLALGVGYSLEFRDVKSYVLDLPAKRPF